MTTPNINTILRADSRSCRYGAPMGDRNVFADANVPVYLQRVHFVDGDYGPDGTYWGGGLRSRPMWCAFDAPAAKRVRVYARASSRKEAARLITAEFPSIVFIKEPK